MKAARKLFKSIILCAVLALSIPFVAGAHPVTQGSLTLKRQAERLTLEINASQEQVLVEAMHRPADDTSGQDEGHAQYLLRHFKVSLDGVPLSGSARIDDATAPPGFRRYRLDYNLPQGAPAGISVVLHQDVLREILYAPGNPWEASYIVEIDGANDAAPLLLAPQSDLAVGLAGDHTAGDAFWTFFSFGIHHILEGYDHLLFVTALVLAALSLWDLIVIVSIFTLAHTLTLVLATYRIVSMPPSIVEPMIAASIVFVAAQNFFIRPGSRSPARRLMTFLFGLFHGLGFAGGMIESLQALGSSKTIIGLLGFSVGVEAGHQIVVIPLFLLLALIRAVSRFKPQLAHAPRAVYLAGSAIVVCAGIYYCAEAVRGNLMVG